MELKKQPSVEKPIVKGYNIYKSGKVLELYSKDENSLFKVKSQIQPSYSTDGPIYAVKIVINGNSEIQNAFRACPAGNDGRCNNLATLSAAWDPYYKKDIQKLERVQRKAAPFCTGNHSPYASVAELLHEQV